MVLCFLFKTKLTHKNKKEAAINEKKTLFPKKQHLLTMDWKRLEVALLL